MMSILDLDYGQEADKIANAIKLALRKDLNRRGLVVAMSGGIDSSVCAALSVRAIGKERVLGLMLPENESSPDSLRVATELAKHLGIRSEVQEIGETLDAIGCYRERDAAIKEVFPEYSEGWKNKIVISGGMSGAINFFQLVVETPDGGERRESLPLKQYLAIVAATNYKQRIRKTIEYFHADKLNYAVVGTPNRLEYDQGFFVKNGDGSADVKPIAHLYKTQVYGMAEYLGLPASVCGVMPTTDTYTLEQGQDEFYFGLPYGQMDVALFFFNEERSASELAAELGVSVEQAEHIYRDIETKRRTTRYQHLRPVVVENVLVGNE